MVVFYLQYRDPETFTLLDGFPVSTEVITGREQFREFHQRLKYTTTTYITNGYKNLYKQSRHSNQNVSFGKYWPTLYKGVN